MLVPMRSLALALGATVAAAQCPTFDDYSSQSHDPLSSGKHKLAFQRPTDDCKTFKVDAVESTITSIKENISDPDVFRLFENSWPNTVDTTVQWRGSSADNSDEELAFITTGDIHAMWLRDSANQLQSFKSLLGGQNPSSDIASLFRGAINLQARFVTTSPYCNSFQPPVESGQGSGGSGGSSDKVTPSYDPNFVFECKYELDSLAAFLQLSWDYYSETKDGDFFGKFGWVAAVKSVLETLEAMMVGTYDSDGNVVDSPYTWQRSSTSATESVSNGGQGEPVSGGIGLVRSFFRPSDDSCTFQYFIPANMMMATYLQSCVEIMRPLDGDAADQMQSIADGIRKGIEENAVVDHPKFGKIYAYEIDGFGSFNLMDDANLPSLLSIPHLGYVNSSDTTYQNTRNFALSQSNRYYGRGSVISAPGGPHQGPGRPWPMAKIMQILTSDDEDEIKTALGSLVSSTNGLGLIHESIASNDASSFTRPWFAWANGLFGQMILDLNDRLPNVLQSSFQ